MRSDFMNAVGAYMTLTSLGSSGYAAGVRVGDTTLTASSLRLATSPMGALSPMVRFAAAADRVGVGANADMLTRLAPTLARLDIGILSACNATTRMTDDRVAASAQAVEIGGRPRGAFNWYGGSAEAWLSTVRAYALEHVHSRNLNGNEAARLAGLNLELEDAKAAVTVQAANAGVVRTGSGNDTIVALNTSDVIAGEGDDMITTRRSGAIHAGEGNNSISATEAGHINAGAGNDRIVAITAGMIHAGGGNNSIVAKDTGHIEVGDGDDIIVAEGTGHIHAGNGRNVINANEAGNIHLGWGDDVVNATGTGHVYGGDGRNVMTIAHAMSVSGGKDADRISASRVGWVEAGDGDNVMALADIGWMKSGDGRDTVAVAGANRIDSGAGDDTIDAADVRQVIAGTGNDRLTLARATALYRRGDGTDTIRAGADAKVEFAGIRAADVDIKVERDQDGRATAIDVSLKDGSGGVKILAGPGGIGDATIRFADGTSVPFAMVAGGR